MNTKPPPPSPLNGVQIESFQSEHNSLEKFPKIPVKIPVTKSLRACNSTKKGFHHRYFLRLL